ncbi:hypothetical protein [Streptomyces jumonjinensis]|uniref:hypothetical protein n=1 Tax=Streptomyces jumonjinensis TaxID=1945 RepID=UPI001E389F6A|nr:hypothetical protein [Streptomyces jumonjinensis]
MLTAMSWLGPAVGAPLFNPLSDRWRDRRAPAVAGVLPQGAVITLLIHPLRETNSVSVPTVFAVGLFAGAHLPGFTVAGEPENRSPGRSSAESSRRCPAGSGPLHQGDGRCPARPLTAAPPSGP